jgi:large subunit ribosomal protein L3
MGGTTFPGRVLKGQRMAGHMGNDQVTQCNLKVIQADPDRNLLLLGGATPGAKNGLLLIKKSRKSKKEE